MIDLTEIKHIEIYSDLYYELQLDLIELNRKIPLFNWVVDNEYTNLLRIDSTNVNKDIRFYWNEAANITCTVDDFEVAANCTMEETISELKDYLVEQWIVK
jgi:hypothetical protein